ncbi:uncharacterized protein LOC142523873 [Primulina tabacum]|uniref:uncharacterized protein LOC142523873 n=1 Tax=Primulina tabacum TaxID=48773 RepID=UPI003F59C6A1
MITSSEPGTLQSNIETNPKNQAKAIELKSGKILESREKEKNQLPDAQAETSKGKSSNSTPAPNAPSKIVIPTPFPAALKKAKLDAQFGKFLEDILENKRKLEDHMMVNLTENCSSLVQNKIPPKRKDPGSFSIPCMIGDAVFHKALCYLGASINLMPLSGFRKPGLGEPKPRRTSLQLANRSVKYRRGVIEDVLVKVDKFIFPAYFVVLDMQENMEMPLILGRPFLATGKPLIDVQEGKLRLRVGEDDITFDDAIKDLLTATLATELREDELDEEKAEIVAYLNANHTWKRSIRMRLEDLGDRRDLTPQKSSIEEPPTLELKPLPPHLKYVYLDVMEDKLLKVFEAHKSEFAWKVADIRGINPSVCMHKILMEDEYSPLVQPQRRLNPKMQEVVKAETIKLLDAGIIYPISDSAWNLKVVLMRCEETNLVLNWEKCCFMVQEGIVLGHKISEHGIEVDKEKVEVIKNLPHPASIKGAYEDLKESLVMAPVLVALDWDLPFEVMCDASDTVVGDVLGQWKRKVTVYTNHSALKYLLAKKDAKPRLLKWILLLQEFDLEIKDKKGVENVVADHLSRLELISNDCVDHAISDWFPDEQLFEVNDVCFNWINWKKSGIWHMISHYQTRRRQRGLMTSESSRKFHTLQLPVATVSRKIEVTMVWSIRDS